MPHFRTKNDLLKWLENNAPRKAIANAMIGGRMELLGIFNPAPESLYPGWIVKIISKRGMTWYITINANHLGQRMFANTIKEVPWEKYQGGEIGLYAGDDPELYKRLRDEKQQK